jgi:hypothetical protein
MKIILVLCGFSRDIRAMYAVERRWLQCGDSASIKEGRRTHRVRGGEWGLTDSVSRRWGGDAVAALVIEGAPVEGGERRLALHHRGNEENVRRGFNLMKDGPRVEFTILVGRWWWRPRFR